MNTVHGKEPYSSLFFAQYPGKVTPVTQVFVSKQHGKQNTLVLSSIMFLYFESFQATVPTALPHQPKAVWKRVTRISKKKRTKKTTFFSYPSYIRLFMYFLHFVFVLFCLVSTPHKISEFGCQRAIIILHKLADYESIWC